MTTDDVILLIESTANMLRGMTLDPAIPTHAKSACSSRIQTLEEKIEEIETEGISNELDDIQKHIMAQAALAAFPKLGSMENANKVIDAALRAVERKP